MIAYKWAIKKENKIYSLMNFHINSWMNSMNLLAYEPNKIYEYKGEYAYLVHNCHKKFNREIDGFHFWKNKKINRKILFNWNRYLQNHNQPKINCLLKCQINKIKFENNCCGEPRIIANEFKILRIYNL